MKVLTACLAVFALAITASASPICTTSTATSCTQIVDIPPSGTIPVDVNNALGTFGLFGSMPGIPVGAVLNSVTLEIVINESLTALSLTNTGSAATSSTHYIVQANFDDSVSANATDSTNLDAALSNSGNNGDPLATIANIGAGSIASGGVFTCTAGAPCNLPRTLSVDTGAISGTTSSYTGAGTFTIGFSTATGFTVTGFGGGNVNVSQTNVASAVATVVYNYTVPSGVPEPATLAIFGSSLVALALVGRKKILGK